MRCSPHLRQVRQLTLDHSLLLMFPDALVSKSCKSCAALVSGLLVWSFVFLIQPLSHEMKEVKLEYCGGNQDFVIKANADVQMSVGIETVPHGHGAEVTLSNLAVDELLQSGFGALSYNYTVVAETLRDFARWSTGTIKQWSVAMLHGCHQWDDSTFLNSAAFALGRSGTGTVCGWSR